MKAIMRLLKADGASVDIVLKEGPWADGEVVEEEMTGLRLGLQRSGVCLLDKEDYPAGLMVPVQFLPAIWSLKADEPILRIFQELRRCGRDASYSLDWGQWLLSDSTWRKAQFLIIER